MSARRKKKKRPQSYASFLQNSGPSFLNKCVARPHVKRKLWTADNKFNQNLKEEINESIVSPEESGNPKKG
ncbi:hypothetical protein TNCV_1553151 [Trichonephila clavipes]|nr:hypothetical protein TNCV_1553151 [Trichonephila clavipes]